MAGSPEWTIEYAWQCARHNWNTCPLTEAALRFSNTPCCDEATVITTREVLTPYENRPTTRPETAPESAGLLHGARSA